MKMSEYNGAKQLMRSSLVAMVAVFAMAVDVQPEVPELPLDELTEPSDYYYHGQPCGLPGQTVHIKPYNGDARCCIELLCPMGTVGQLCDIDDRTTTQCVPCEDGQFMPSVSNSSDMIECYTSDPCSLTRGFRIKRLGNLTTDNECECDLTSGYWEEIKLDPEMKDYELICWFRDCVAGHELTDSGCQPCMMGMFKANDGIEQCIHWTNCGRLGLAYGPGGNRTYDPKCIPGPPTISPVITTSSSREIDGITRGAIVGSVLGGVMVILFCIFLLFWCVHRRRTEAEKNGNPSGHASRPLAALSQTYSATVGSQTCVIDTYEIPRPPTASRSRRHSGSHSSGSGEYQPIVGPSRHVTERCDSNLSSPGSNKYEDIDRLDPDAIEDAAELGSIEEDSEPFTDTPPQSTPNTPSSIRVTSNNNDAIININGDTINVQIGKQNQMEVDT